MLMSPKRPSESAEVSFRARRKPVYRDGYLVCVICDRRKASGRVYQKTKTALCHKCAFGETEQFDPKDVISIGELA